MARNIGLKLIKIGKRLDAARLKVESLREKWMEAGRIYNAAEEKMGAIGAEYATTSKSLHAQKKPHHVQFDYEALDRAADLRVRDLTDRCGAENSEGDQCVRAVFHGGAHRT